MRMFDELRQALIAMIGGRPRPAIRERESAGGDPAAAVAARARSASPPDHPVLVVEPRRDRAPFAILLIAAVAVLWIARGVLGPFIVAAVLAYAFSPLVAAGERRTGWPRIALVG